jgi:hypothetical protein
MNLPDNLVPLVYLVAIAGIAGGLHYGQVDPSVTALIVGAGITRIKRSNGNPEVVEPEPKPPTEPTE